MTRTDEHLGATDTYDSINWIYEVHLKQPDTGIYNYAMFYGYNEDSPDRIKFWKDEPDFDTPPDYIWYPATENEV